MGKDIKDVLSSKSFGIALEGLDGEAYGYGYTINLKPDNTINMYCYEAEAELMPTVTVTPILDGEDVYLEPKLTFPELDSTKLEYYDSIQHYLKKWAEVGRFISQMMKWHFNVNTEYED